jgi:tyrosyl-tRNA synthetase
MLTRWNIRSFAAVPYGVEGSSMPLPILSGMETPDARTAVLDDLAWRQMIADHTDLDALRSVMSAGPITYYGGFDPTAPSLHFGNLVLLVTMRRLQLAGHRPIGLVGGATGLVGDPSGRTAERALNDPDVIAGWVERIRSQVERYLSFDGPNAATIVNNLDWTGELTAIQWLRDIGKHFSVSRMLAKEAVAARIESGGISYTEFSYQVMQAVDFLELYRRHDCTLQLGGSDQWGNLTAGVDLIRRVEAATAHALATPLITRPDGEKFGKSTGSTLWLDPELTSQFAFYQWFLTAPMRPAPPSPHRRRCSGVVTSTPSMPRRWRQPSPTCHAPW